MAISTYAELKTAVENWTKREGDTVISNRAPEFISIAEAVIANDVRCAAMNTRSTANISTQYFDTPTGFLEIRDIQLNTDPVQNLEFLTPKGLSKKFPSATTGKPRFYALHGDEFEVKPVPASTYEIEIDYIKRFTAFSADADTNWLLTNHPQIYLYASLMLASDFTENADQFMKYQDLYGKAVASLTKSEERAKYGNNLNSRVNTATP